MHSIIGPPLCRSSTRSAALLWHPATVITKSQHSKNDIVRRSKTLPERILNCRHELSNYHRLRMIQLITARRADARPRHAGSSVSCSRLSECLCRTHAHLLFRWRGGRLHACMRVHPVNSPSTLGVNAEQRCCRRPTSGPV